MLDEIEKIPKLFPSHPPLPPDPVPVLLRTDVRHYGRMRLRRSGFQHSGHRNDTPQKAFTVTSGIWMRDIMRICGVSLRTEVVQ